MLHGQTQGSVLLSVGTKRARSPDASGPQEIQQTEREVCHLLQQPSSDVRSKGEEEAKPRRLEDQAAGSVGDPPCNETDEEYRCKQVGCDGGQSNNDGCNQLE